MVVLKIILIVTLLFIMFHVVTHLLIVFWGKMTQEAVNEVLKDPHRYIRDEHMCYFIRNMVYLFLVLTLTIAVFQGKVNISKKTNAIEVKGN